MSWQSALACWCVRIGMRPQSAKPELDVALARKYASRRLWSPRVPKGWRFEIRDNGEWLSPATRASATILYLHGGGYYFCSPRSHRAITFGLATRAHASVVSLDYRLAPEHRFPAALDDSVAAYRRLLADGVPAQSIVIAGDSAGGGLALATLLALRDAADPLPAAAVLFSPWTDLTCAGESMRFNEGRDPMYHASVFPRVAAQYLGGADARDPYASPLFGDFTGLPPLMIHVGDTELLLDDSTRVATKARAAGVRVDMQTWRDVPHIFQIWAPFMPEARESLTRAAAFIDAATCAARPHRPLKTSIV
ncbi:Alpha/beta hydrolase fold-3 domain protein [Burkholderia sp. YI23]|uniref:alpha/beta hydrolase n=1 Tax=unclassified Caballeronia TaxID=2646786 RepID=UPI0002388EFF|nr:MULTISPECIES: alpha/beta hydrolase [unclassified Caballeronia]AET88119.1 Alpha/beta hydrolase fold-3 domain protein [Burkholderia sp. YI23]MCE4542943.1 alpha/beta hydrolase [Caballeronia sp. PC1]MCE4568001.1 alpha/beta hydrolase [Caballeronia sp. CLC5]